MILLKILGSIDLAATLAFLMLIFGIDPWLQYILFCSGLLLCKGLFAITGDVLSFVDLVAAVALLVSLLIALPSSLLWVFAFLLLAKGVVSFI